MKVRLSLILPDEEAVERPAPRPRRQTRPTNPTVTPSIRNGQRMNQLVAPTSFMISTSRLRAKMESRMVLEMSSTATMPSSTMKIEQEVAGLRGEG